MRNVFKSAYAQADSRVRRSVRGISAAVASVALVAGLGSYPAEVAAQEPQPAAAPATVVSSNAEPASPVQVERIDGTDHITISDPDGAAWGYGAKASLEDIFAFKRVGSGDIEEILKVTIDGTDLDPEFYGYVNNAAGGFLAFDLDALTEIPPRKVEFTVRTSGDATYAIAESDEVPTARELAASGYGQNPAAAATVNPDGVGQARAATQSNSQINLSLAPLTYTSLNAQTRQKPPHVQFETKIQGNSIQRNVYLTELVLTYNGRYGANLEGPIYLEKNGTEWCTVDGARITPLRTEGNYVRSVSVDLSQCDPQTVVWQGSGDRIKVQAYGPGTSRVDREYTMELYGSYTKGPQQPAPTTAPTKPTTSTQPTAPNPGTTTSAPQASASAKFSANSQNLSLSNVTTTGNNPYQSTFTVNGASNFSGATVTIDAPKSILTGEDYTLTVDGVERTGARYGIGHTVKSRTNDKVEIEFYPTQDGKRINAMPLVDGALFTLNCRFGGNPQATGTIRIDGQPRTTTNPGNGSTGNAPVVDGPLSGEYKLPLGPAVLSTSTGDAQRKQLTAELGGTLTKRTVYPTRVRISYNGTVNDKTVSMSGPVTFTKQTGESCTIQNPRPVATQRQPRGTSVVTALEADLSSCPIKFWEGAGDTMTVTFNGPGGATGSTGTYTMEAWGRQDQPNSSGQPIPGNTGGSPVDANGKCVSNDPEITVQPRLAKRDITEEERLRGTEIYVSTSAADNGQNTNHAAMTHTLLSVQTQGSATFAPVGSSRWIYNGLAYNPEDNWLYAVSQHRGSSSAPDPCYPAGHLLQIDPATGAVRDLGPVLNNRGVTPFMDADKARDLTLLNSGVIYNNGLYVSNSSNSGSRDMYRIDLPPVGSANPFGRNTGFQGYSEDYAILPNAPEYAWGLVSREAYKELGFGYYDSNGGWHTSDGVYIERINLATGAASRWELRASEKRALGGGTLRQKVTWGKAWTYGNGNLGFAQGGDSANQESPGVQLAITNPTAYRPSLQVINILDTVPDSYNTDAASNARRTPPSTSDLAITKVAISKGDSNQYPGFDKSTMDSSRTYWAIKVTNPGPHLSPGSVVNDVVPEVYSDVRLVSEYGQQKDGYRSSIQISPNDRTPSTSGPFGTGSTPVQYVVGAMQPGDEVWMYLSATLRNGAQCLPNTASVTNNDIDPAPGNDTSSAGCPPIVEIHKSFVGDGQEGSHLRPLADGSYEVNYRITVTNKTSSEVWYDPPIDEVALPTGFVLKNASVTYTNEWGNKNITCAVNDDNGYLKPSEFKQGAATRFRLQDCRKESSEYKGFDGRLTELGSVNAARDHRHIDAQRVVFGKTVTGTHTYDVRMVLTVDENSYLNAYPNAGVEQCLAENGALVNTGYLGGTPSEHPCTYPRISRPELKLYKRADTVAGENISQLGVEFSLYEDNGGKPGGLVSGMQVDGDALMANDPLRYNTKYWLVETRAPKNFSLLVEPIGIVIKKDAQGQAYVEVQNNQAVAQGERGQDGKTNLAILSVANVRQGELPKTGGVGVGIPAAVGLALVGCGAALGMRRRVVA